MDSGESRLDFAHPDRLILESSLSVKAETKNRIDAHLSC